MFLTGDADGVFSLLEGDIGPLDLRLGEFHVKKTDTISKEVVGCMKDIMDCCGNESTLIFKMGENMNRTFVGIFKTFLDRENQYIKPCFRFHPPFPLCFSLPDHMRDFSSIRGH